MGTKQSTDKVGQPLRGTKKNMLIPEVDEKKIFQPFMNRRERRKVSHLTQEDLSDLFGGIYTFFMGEFCHDKKYPDLSDKELSKRYRNITQKVLRLEHLSLQEAGYVGSDEAMILTYPENKQVFYCVTISDSIPLLRLFMTENDNKSLLIYLANIHDNHNVTNFLQDLYPQGEVYPEVYQNELPQIYYNSYIHFCIDVSKKNPEMSTELLGKNWRELDEKKKDFYKVQALETLIPRSSRKNRIQEYRPPYSWFYKDNFEKLKENNPKMNPPDLMDLLDKNWNALKFSDKFSDVLRFSKYKLLAAQDKKRADKYEDIAVYI